MPFVPLTPEEKEQFKPACTHPEHRPPSHMVIHEVMKWVCPACGASVILRPPTLRWSDARFDNQRDIAEAEMATWEANRD